MNKIAEKLAAIEDQVAVLNATLSPLTSKLGHLAEKITDFSSQLNDLAAEAVAVNTDVETTRRGLDAVLAGIAETKVEGELIASKQNEDQQLRDSMTAMFGEAFQVVSRFLDTAQRIGILDKGKADAILAAKKPDIPPFVAQPIATEPVVEPLTEEVAAPEASEVETIAKTIREAPEPEAELAEAMTEVVAEEPVTEESEPVNEASPEVSEPIEAAEAFADKPAEEEPVQAEANEPSPEVLEPIEAAEAFANKPAEEELVQAEDPAFSELFSETDLTPSAEAAEIAKLSLPQLPDVSSSVESLPPVEETVLEEEVPETPAEITSQLELPPLALEEPEIPSASSDVEAASDISEDDIEAMLKDLSKPIST